MSLFLLVGKAYSAQFAYSLLGFSPLGLSPLGLSPLGLSPLGLLPPSGRKSSGRGCSGRGLRVVGVPVAVFGRWVFEPCVPELGNLIHAFSYVASQFCLVGALTETMCIADLVFGWVNVPRLRPVIYEQCKLPN